MATFKPLKTLNGRMDNVTLSAPGKEISELKTILLLLIREGKRVRASLFLQPPLHHRRVLDHFPTAPVLDTTPPAKTAKGAHGAPEPSRPKADPSRPPALFPKP